MTLDPIARDRINAEMHNIAVLALADGITPDGDGKPTDPLPVWLRAHGVPQEKEFFVYFLVAMEMADILAQREGYANQSERAWAKIAEHEAQP